MLHQKFIGTWQLKAFEQRGMENDAAYPMGSDCRGILMYDSSGRLSVHLMRAGRPFFSSGDPFGGAADKCKAACDGYISYLGHYEIDEELKTISHHIEGSMFPNWVGVTQVRHYEFEDKDSMILSTLPMEIGGRTGVSVLTWSRVA